MKSQKATRTSHSEFNDIPTVPIYRPHFEPLRSHWTIAGHDRDADMKAYKAIPSAYKETWDAYGNSGMRYPEASDLSGGATDMEETTGKPRT